MWAYWGYRALRAEAREQHDFRFFYLPGGGVRDACVPAFCSLL